VIDNIRGYGSALGGNTRRARQYIVMARRDRQLRPGAIGAMVQACGREPDLVVAIGFSVDWLQAPCPGHTVISQPASFGLLNLSPDHRRDVHCGSVRSMRTRTNRLALKTTGMDSPARMVARAARIKLNIAEVPVDYHPRAANPSCAATRRLANLRFLLM